VTQDVKFLWARKGTLETYGHTFLAVSSWWHNTQ